MVAGDKESKKKETLREETPIIISENSRNSYH
jgi:hypothetical protein